jgi:hypothetical protein
VDKGIRIYIGFDQVTNFTGEWAVNRAYYGHQQGQYGPNCRNQSKIHQNRGCGMLKTGTKVQSAAGKENYYPYH